jgi:hypothetical protein
MREMRRRSEILLASVGVGGVGALVTGVFVACSAYTASSTADATDGGAPEASAALEGSADAGPALPFCVQADAQFCADFDEGFLQQGWQQLVQTEAGARLDDAASVSPPASFVADTTSSPPAPADNVALLVKPLSSTPLSTLSCAFSVRADTMAMTANSQATIFYVSGNGKTPDGGLDQTFNLWIALGNNGTAGLFAAYAVANTQSQLMGGPIDAVNAAAWTRLQIDLTFSDPCKVSAKVSRIDPTSGAVSLTNMPADFVTGPDGGGCAPKETSVQLGISAAGGWLVRFDDFACNWSP